MHSKRVRIAFVTSTALLALSVSQTRSARSSSPNTSPDAATTLLLEKDQGEKRLWRPEPGETDTGGGFILKVSPENNGSQHLVLLTEDMLPGDVIPTHKHLQQDEI